MTYTEIIDYLEKELIKDPIVLWQGEGVFPGSNCRLRGLSLMGGSRTLRKAVEQMHG